LSRRNKLLPTNRSLTIVVVPLMYGIYSVVQVSVRFIVVPLTAVSGVDYTVSGTSVSLLDGQHLALVPISLIRSTQPKLARSFIVRLLDSTTGGAAVGQPAQCVVTIRETRDAHGIFGNQPFHAFLILFL